MTAKILEEEKYTFLQRIEYFFNTLNHVFIGFITIYLSYVCFKAGLTSISLHAWLCTIGYNLLMAEAIMAHYRGNVLTYTYSRKMKTTIHWVFQAIGGGLCIAGMSYVIWETTETNRPHFSTTHAKLGLAALILCCLSMISGLSALYSQTLRKILSPLLNKHVHFILGLAAFVIGMVTLFYGYEETYFLKAQKIPLDFITLLSVLTLCTCVFSSIGPILSIYDKFKAMLNFD